jgi:hypothetical protein
MTEIDVRALIRRSPFGECSVPEWSAIASYLQSLSHFLGMPLEFTGDRVADRDNFSPLIRCSKSLNATFDVRIAGMISCTTTSRNSGLRIDSLLFLFSHGNRVAPPGLTFFIYDYSPVEAGPDWVARGWQTSDFPEQWSQYTFRLFFGG